MTITKTWNHGRRFERVARKEDGADPCRECAAWSNRALCEYLDDCVDDEGDPVWVWKEIKG